MAISDSEIPPRRSLPNFCSMRPRAAVLPLLALAVASVDCLTLPAGIRRTSLLRACAEDGGLPKKERLSRAMPQRRDLLYSDFGLISRERRNRAYASRRGFRRIASGDINADDEEVLLPPAPKEGDERWLSGGFRLSVIGGASLAYPLLLKILGPLADTARGQNVATLTSSFSPAVSILFGTLLSLTVSIQYTRLAKIQVSQPP